jgi:hypothetical protein
VRWTPARGSLGIEQLPQVGSVSGAGVPMVVSETAKFLELTL